MMNGSSTVSSSAGSSSSLPPSTSLPSSSASSVSRAPKKLLGSFGFTSGGTFNWEIPPFPGEKPNESKGKEEVEIKHFSNRGSQVEDRDWALLEVEQSGFTFDLCYAVGSSGPQDTDKIAGDDLRIDDEIIFTRECYKNRNEPRIDRGTYCDGLTGYCGYEEKVQKLTTDFPLADGAHIEEVLNACHGDYHWAFNLLSQFNEEHFTNAASAVASSNANISNRVNSTNDMQIIQESSSPDLSSSPSPETAGSESRPDIIHGNSHGFDIASHLISENVDQQNSQFTFYLDPAFADQLQSSFGQVLKEGEIDEKYLRVECSGEVGRLIHYLWVKAYNSSTKDNAVPVSTNNFDIGAIFNLTSLNKPVKKSNKHHSNNCMSNTSNSNKKEVTVQVNEEMPYEPKSAFQEIMDLEMAINLSRKEFKSSPFNQANSKHAISTKLKRECLRSSYPGLDEKALEELFEANNYRIKETIESIDDTLGIQTTITPEVYKLIAEETGNYDNHYDQSTSRSPELTNGDSIRQLRSQIHECMEKRKELSDKGNSAFRAKMYAVASYYKSQAREYDHQISELRSQVIDTVIRANPSNSLDLHGVHANEVLTTLGSYLSNKIEEIKRRRINKLRVLIITGRGAHSISGPRLKPLVINYLKQKRYRHEVINPGVIAVTIP